MNEGGKLSLGRRGCEGKAYLVWSFSHCSSLFLIGSKLNQSSPARASFACGSFLSLLSHEHFHLILSPCFAEESGLVGIWQPTKVNPLDIACLQCCKKQKLSLVDGFLMHRNTVVFSIIPVFIAVPFAMLYDMMTAESTCRASLTQSSVNRGANTK